MSFVLKSEKESPKDPLLQEDLERFTDIKEIPFDQLSGKTVLVTGATGLIGSFLVKALACANRKLDTRIQIYALARSQKKAQKVFGSLLDREDIHLLYADVADGGALEAISCKADYVIHGASATSSKFFVSNPVETIHTAIQGTVNVLEYAKRVQAKGVLYLSSLEVYGTPAPDAGLIDESYSGYIDPMQVRSSYSEGKRMAECICASYALEYQVPVRVARLSQTFGAGVDYEDGRVFAEFARCALEKKDIVLHTAGKTVRSYCYMLDAASALFLILLKGENGGAYNVTNMDTKISIADMAKLVCNTFPEAGIQVVFDQPKDVSSFGYNPEMVITMDSKKLMSLGWKPTVGLSEMFIRLAKSMSGQKCDMSEGKRF